MLTTTILGEAIGVQHGGIQDRTSSNTVQGITHGLIIGKFKRGRTDQPMRINKDTIKARLGYEPNNPFYQVVQDCVDKFPSVWVLRVGVSAGGGGVVVPPVEQISCEGATDSISLIDDLPYRTSNDTIINWSIEVNGVLYENVVRDTNGTTDDPAGIYIENYLPNNQDILGITADYINNLTISNISNENKRVRLIPDLDWDRSRLTIQDNPTGLVTDAGVIEFCLTPAQIDPPELGILWEKDSSGKIASVLRAKLNIDALNVSTMYYDVFLLDENDEKLYTLKSEINVSPSTRYFNFAEDIAEILKSDQNSLLKIRVKVTATGLDGSVLEREAGGILKRISNRIALAKQNGYTAQRTRIFDPGANELPGYNYAEPPILDQGYLYSANQEYSDSVFLENVSEKYLMVKVWMNPKVVEPVHSSNDNECYVAVGDYVTVELAPRQLEVLVIPSGAPDANRTVNIHPQTVLLYEYFEAKYGKEFVPNATMEIRFIVPEYQDIIIGRQDTAKWGNYTLAAGTALKSDLVALPSVGVLNLYKSYDYRAASGHAIIVGKTPTLGNLIFNDSHGRTFAWNNAKLLIDIRGRVIASGGRGAPYYTDHNNPDGSIITTGQNGWEPICNINTDCKVRVIVDNGYLASGGGGAGISSAAVFHFARSDDPTQTKDLFIPAREGGGGAAFGDPFTLRNTGLVNNRFGYGATVTEGGHLMLSEDNSLKCLFGAGVGGSDSEAWVIVAASTTYGGELGKTGGEAGEHTIIELNGVVETASPEISDGTTAGVAGSVVKSNIGISVYCKYGQGGGISIEYPGGYPALPDDEWAF